MVKFIVWELKLLVPSVAVKLKLAVVVSEPLCTKRTKPKSIWAWVKVFCVFQLTPSLTCNMPFVGLFAV